MPPWLSDPMVGHLVVLAGVLAAVIRSYYRLHADHLVLAERLTDLSTRVAALERQVGTLEATIAWRRRSPP